MTMLGFYKVKRLVLSSSVLEMMDEALPGLWAHSLACARASVFIAEHLGLPDAEELSVISVRNWTARSAPPSFTWPIS